MHKVQIIILVNTGLVLFDKTYGNHIYFVHYFPVLFFKVHFLKKGARKCLLHEIVRKLARVKTLTKHISIPTLYIYSF